MAYRTSKIITSTSVENHAIKLCARMYELNQSGKYCDLILVAAIDGKRIPVNRLFLSAFSPYFKALLSGSMQEAGQNVVTISEVGGDTLQALIRFCHIGKIDIRPNNVDEMLAAASRMELVQVEEFCEQHYRMVLEVENCLSIWLLAEQYNFNELARTANDLALEMFYELVNEEEFLDLKEEALGRLLSDDNLYVYSELDVLDALILWIRHDENNRKSLFVDLMNLVRLDQLNMDNEATSAALMKCCSDWASMELFGQLVKSISNTDGISTKFRVSLSRPIPLLVGGDSLKIASFFSIGRFRRLQKDLHEFASGGNYLNGHSVVQVGQYLYILGGEDINGHSRNEVRRVNIRDWSMDEVNAMAQSRAHFPSVLLDGCIYVIGANFATSTTKDLVLDVERYNIAEDTWTEVAALDLFNQTRRHIKAIAYSGQIYAIYPCGMSCYDPATNEWTRKATVPKFGAQFDVFINKGELQIVSYEPKLDAYAAYNYDAVNNRWGKAQNVHFAEHSPDYYFNLEHRDALYKFEAVFNKSAAINCWYYANEPVHFTCAKRGRLSEKEKHCFGKNFIFVVPNLF